MASRRGRNEGSVEQVGPNRWRGILSLGVHPTTGRRRRLKLYGRTKGEALAKLRDAQARRASGTLADAGAMTLADWLARWLGHKGGSVEATTLAVYRQHVEGHLRVHSGALRLATLRPLAVADLFARLAAAGVSNALAAKLATTLRAALADAVKAGLIPTNPAKAVAKPKADRPEVRPLTPDEVLTFCDALACHPAEALFRVALDSGLRQGELFALLPGCVDADAGVIHVRRSLAWVKGKGLILKDVKTKHSRRSVRLSPPVADLLREHLAGRAVQPGRPVFADGRGGFLRKSNVLRRWFDPLIDYAGLPPVRFHDLRHSHATLLLLAGVNVKAVSRRLGHSSITITLETYGHVLPEMDDQILDALGRLYGVRSDSPPAAP